MSPPCAALSPTGYACTLDKGHGGDYHEARKAAGQSHVWAPGAVVARWPRGATIAGPDYLLTCPLCGGHDMEETLIGVLIGPDPNKASCYRCGWRGPIGEARHTFEERCAAELAASDAAEHEAVKRGDAAPEEVEARRKQMRAVE